MKLKKLAILALTGLLCLTTFVGCGVNADEIAATLGDQTVSAGVVNFVCKYQKAGYDDMYISWFGEDAWGQDLYGNGTTLEEDLKDSVMTSLHDLYTLKAHMTDYNIELTEEDEAAIKEAAQAFIAANSEAAIKEFGATEEIVVEVLRLYTIQAKMYDAIVVDTDRNVTDQEANMRGISLVEIGLEGSYGEDGYYIEYTDADIAAFKLKAEKIVKEVGNVGFEKAAEQNGYTISDTSYSMTDDTLDKTLVEALNALEVGEISNVIETETALYIARIDEDTDQTATEENREAIITERENQVYSDKLEEWQKDDGWTVNDAVVEKIEFRNILTQTTETTEDKEITEGK